MAKTTAFLKALTAQAREAIGADTVLVEGFPFRVGRESRGAGAHGLPILRERRRPLGRPNNDLYLIDAGRRLNVSREHFQIERDAEGRYALVDRGSAGGTIVEGRAVGGDDRGGRCPLKDGDTIVVGKATSPYLFKFLLRADDE